MTNCFAYVRVSTVRQGEKGTSLGEQRDAIMAFAARHEIKILEWFEERETAAKQGRGEFSRMMRLLKRRRDHGVIFHKIDRGARNLKDWSNIQDLIEIGVSVYFAHESVDMTTRGGRLTADLLAVIASDYIRNLRDEVKKGIRGRLKQGLLPLQAPIGYLDQGGGMPKIPDPLRAPLVRQAFELYATGSYTLMSLAVEMERRGLRNRRGKCLDAKRLDDVLRRPFYMGLIKMAGSVYGGVHQPIISKQLFDRVQIALSGKAQARAIRHEFTYRRMIHCAGCGYRLVGERQKGNVYYRCHTRGCPTTSIREDQIEEAISITFTRVSFTKAQAAELAAIAAKNRERAIKAAEAAKQSLALQLQQTEIRLSKLTDALLDGVVGQSLFESKKAELLLRQAELRDKALETDSADGEERLKKFLELATNLQSGYISGNASEKQEIVKSVTSNLMLCGEKLEITLHSPFREIESRNFPSLVGPNGTDLELFWESCSKIIVEDSVEGDVQVADLSVIHSLENAEVFRKARTSPKLAS